MRRWAAPAGFAYGGAALLFLVTSLASPGFAAPSHLRSIAVVATFIGLVGLGQTLVVIGAGVDLSIPWVLNSAAVLVTLLADGQGAPLGWAMPLIVAAGGLVGFLNGVGIAWFSISPIVMTLAMNVILQGALLIGTGGSPPPMAPAALQFLATGVVLGVPVVLLIWLALTLFATVLLGLTPFGRHLHAIGTNPVVARLAGVPLRRTLIVTYMISGAGSALAGMLLAGYSGQAYLGMGDPYLFTSVAAVAIGGTSILGGSGGYLGTVAGALVLTILTGLLAVFNVSAGALQIIYGVVILATVIFGTPRARLLLRLGHRPEQ